MNFVSSQATAQAPIAKQPMGNPFIEYTAAQLAPDLNRLRAVEAAYQAFHSALIEAAKADLFPTIEAVDDALCALSDLKDDTFGHAITQISEAIESRQALAERKYAR